MTEIEALRAEIETMRDVQSARVRRIRLRPGDLVVLEYPKLISPEGRERFVKQWSDCCPDTRALFLDDGATLAAVLTPTSIPRVMELRGSSGIVERVEVHGAKPESIRK